jgi:hypothetical protein
MTANVSALFVRKDGPYPELVADWWDVERDATRYSGPMPVVAHPPCARWGRFWWADGSTEPGDDGGLFESALASVRRWSGVLEHPEASHAWRAFDLPPPSPGVWCRGLFGGWATCVAQRNYGHRARKMTWLYYVGERAPPSLDWSDPDAGGVYLSQPGRCKAGKPRPRCACARCEAHFGDDWLGANRVVVERMSVRERESTPTPFAHLLIEMAADSRKPDVT